MDSCNRLPQPKWMLCAGVSIIAAALSWWPGAIQHFRYDRDAILSGQVWRLVSGHLVHLNTTHLMVNLAGLFLLCELLWNALPLRHGIGILLASTLGVSLMLWWLDPAVTWYVGLSGVLHGLWAGCALAGLLTLRAARVASNSRRDAWGAWGSEAQCLCIGALMLLGVKLGLEYVAGVELSSASMASRWIGAPVVTAAHRYGAVIGLVYVLAWQASDQLRQAKPAIQG